MNQHDRDEAYINKPDEPYRPGQEIEWDDDHYGWVSTEGRNYEAWWDWREDEWVRIPLS
jgi:hypothetical protein